MDENTNILSHTYAEQVSEYAIFAMQRTCGAGIITGTGGDYGDPFERPAEKVAMDAKNEYITVEQAKEDYGVLLDPETFAVLGFTEERQRKTAR